MVHNFSYIEILPRFKNIPQICKGAKEGALFSKFSKYKLTHFLSQSNHIKDFQKKGFSVHHWS